MSGIEESRTHASLLQRLRNLRDEQAWRKFWERYRPKIHAWARGCGLKEDDAAEITGAVLAKLVRAMPEFDYDPGRRFRGWLKTVVRNAVKDFWRAEGRCPGGRGDGAGELDWLEDPAGADTLVEELNGRLEEEERAAHGVIEQVKARVGPKTWSAFWLTAVEQHKGAEAAAQLGMTVAAVHMAKSRVSAMLRDALARAGAAATGPNDPPR
jgi:RNA polymerase sigma-70 factor (ECF subfamily)